jgi:lysozyme family protein
LADFNSSIETVLRHEGFFSDDKSDPGGATQYGISLSYLLSLPPGQADINKDGEVDAKDIRSLDLEKAKEIYKIGWWDRYHYSEIQDTRVATKILDTAVNVGASQAHKLVQRALGLPDDGILGPQSIKAINAFNPDKLIQGISDEVMSFYVSLTFKRIQSMGITEGGKYLRGWLRRAYDPIQ